MLKRAIGLEYQWLRTKGLPQTARAYPVALRDANQISLSSSRRLRQNNTYPK